MPEFPASAPSADAVFYRTYSRRKADGTRESFEEAMTRCVEAIKKVGDLNEEQAALIKEQALNQHCFPSGRAFWVAGTDWAEQQENFSGWYNCTSTDIKDLDAFGLIMELAMMGSGTGAVLEQHQIDQLPEITTSLNIIDIIPVGLTAKELREDDTIVVETSAGVTISVGDSRLGWVRAYDAIIKLAANTETSGKRDLVLDLSNVRPAGERLQGFGGTANPVKLEDMFRRITALLGRAVGRKLTAVECCLLIDEAAACVVAGNIRRSAGMRQFTETDEEAANCKLGLYIQDENGNWKVDPEREALRMANHTRCYHRKPTLQEVEDSVRQQFASGEGAIQYVPQAIARANVDILDTPEKFNQFIKLYCQDKAAGKAYLANCMNEKGLEVSIREVDHRASRYGLNPCGEIIGADFHCVDGATSLIHKEGIDSIASLEGREVDVWNGSRWSTVTPILTGTNRKLYRVSFSDGTYLDVTSGHRWFVKNRFEDNYRELTTEQLIDAVKTEKYSLFTEHFEIDYAGGYDVPNAYTLGVLIGDGTTVKSSTGKYNSILRLHGKKMELPVDCTNRSESITEGRTTVLCTGFDWEGETVRAMKESGEALLVMGGWSRASILEFIAGLADTDGSEVASGGIRIYQSGYDRVHALYLLLLKCGIRSSINIAGLAGTSTNKGTRSSDLYYLQITDCSDIPCHRLNTANGHKPARKGKNQIISSIVELEGLHDTYCFNEPENHKGVFNGTLTGQCNLAEIHLNTIDPSDVAAQEKAFQAGALQVAALLNHEFYHERYHYSRSIDPIVGVSFTGLFDYLVKAFGAGWLEWMMAGRPNNRKGRKYRQYEMNTLASWKRVVRKTITEYCEQHGLRVPNRCTTVQPAGTKSLLTGASSGWHPPKAQRFIRRITFGKTDPLVSALRDWGYNVIPAQSARDEHGNLLDDIMDPRVQEVLVEIPTETCWARMEGCDQFDLSKIPAESQWDLYMQVQQHYTEHNTSATIEYREAEIPVLSRLIHESIEKDTGYISAALLARFDANETFPRLPFEPIDRETFDRIDGVAQSYRSVLPTIMGKEEVSFLDVLNQYDTADYELKGAAGCDSDKCLSEAEKDADQVGQQI